MGRGFAEPSVFVSFRCPSPPPVVRVADMKDTLREVAIHPAKRSHLSSTNSQCSDQEHQELVAELHLGQAKFDFLW